LFKESCSNYVYRKTKEEGFSSGIKALKHRVRNCSSGYVIMNSKEGKLIVTKSQEVILNEKIAPRLLD